jgi:two-component sensor histidine kinase/predicted hydrocarbon binding protein
MVLKPENIEQKYKALALENKNLRAEIQQLKKLVNLGTDKPTAKVPEQVKVVFEKAGKSVGKYFSNLRFNPEKGTIEVNGERYVLMRASSLSFEFKKTFKKLYADRGEREALSIANNFLFDMSHLVGMEDARNFHRKMKLSHPIDKLSAGPVHFAYTGWAFVHILPESNPVPNNDYFIKYHHPFSFEADSWLAKGEISEECVCIMNAGYSSGWCQQSFGVELTAVEISCRAKGDKHCTFIMAPPHRINEYLDAHKRKKTQPVFVPYFLERKHIEDELNQTLKEKEVLLKEIHHRVKNNLQIISSLLNLQSDTISEKQFQLKFHESVNRVKTMAIMHDLLYQSGDISNINIEDYFNSLCQYSAYAYPIEKKVKVNLRINSDIKVFDLDRGITCGLLINEMITNALKHAFENISSPKINVLLNQQKIRDKIWFELIVADNGNGFPKGFKPENSSGFGFQIIQALAEQLNGKLSAKNSTKGAEISIRFLYEN